MSTISATMSTRPRQLVGGQLASIAEELDRDDRRRRPVDIGAEGAWSERVQVAIVCGIALGEVNMIADSTLVDDVAEELVEADDLMVTDGRPDVPVAEDVPACLQRDRLAAALEVDLAGFDRIDGSPGRSGDIDAEVEALGVVVPVARIVQIRPDGMLAIERLDGPAVAGADGVAMGDGAGLAELDDCRLAPGAGRDRDDEG